jgi:transcriptional regulator with XRE-family HTH domain
MDFKQILGKLKRRRRLRGISYRDLADKTGYCHSTFWGLESGRNNIRLRQLIDWAQALNFKVTLEEDNDEREERRDETDRRFRRTKR